jgi:hypothetical protein
MVQKMPMVTEPAQTKLTETPLEPIDPLDTKIVQSLVSLFLFFLILYNKSFFD